MSLKIRVGKMIAASRHALSREMIIRVLVSLAPENNVRFLASVRVQMTKINVSKQDDELQISIPLPYFLQNFQSAR